MFLVPCEMGEFKCATGYSAWKDGDPCVSMSNRCEGNKDCTDGSDEDPAYCRGMYDVQSNCVAH